MDAADLRVFEAVARLGGVGRAAAELNTVQSNVTARIRRRGAFVSSALATSVQRVGPESVHVDAAEELALAGGDGFDRFVSLLSS